MSAAALGLPLREPALREASILGALGMATFTPRRVGGAFLTLAALSWIPLLVLDRSVAGLAVGVVLLDLGVQGSHVSNLARVHALPGAERSRRNTVYMVAYFAGGAAGTAFATFAWSRWAWPGAVAVGAAAPALALLAWSVGGRADAPAPETASAGGGDTIVPAPGGRPAERATPGASARAASRRRTGR